MLLNPADSVFREQLAGKCGEAIIRPYEDRYGKDLRGRLVGQEGIVAAPSSTEEVSIILRHCSLRKVPVIPFGGGTGLVGGHLPQALPKPVILSFERMNRIRRVHPGDNAIVVEAGCVLQSVHSAAEDVNRSFPLSLAARGSSQIGGNLATNAGGIHVVRFGSMRDLCLGIEAVFPDGQIWDGLSLLRKDNAGYDLKNLLIGSEGTLAAITAASLKLFHRLNDEATAFLAVSGLDAALELFNLFQERFGQQLSAFEILSGTGLRFLSTTFPEVRLPFADVPEWMVLADVGAVCGDEMQNRVADTATEAIGRGWVEDGVVAQSEAQRDEFWKVREMIPEANRRIGSVSSHDVSVPVSSIPEFVARADAAVAKIGTFQVNCFGHAGDGNLHYNVFPASGSSRADCLKFAPAIRAAIHKLVRELDGSIAAEHGIGRTKAAELVRFGDGAYLNAIASVKAALDPVGIMNPGTVLAGQVGFGGDEG